MTLRLQPANDGLCFLDQRIPCGNAQGDGDVELRLGFGDLGGEIGSGLIEIAVTKPKALQLAHFTLYVIAPSIGDRL